MIGAYRIEAYVIASADGMIADASGAQPASLHFEADPDNSKARLWNPAGASFEAACAALSLSSGTVAVIGGPQVFTLFLKLGYDCFHLSRAVKVHLPAGSPVFGGAPDAAL